MLSIPMIAQNEEKYLCIGLESLKGIIDEMIIVDTCSNDGKILDLLYKQKRFVEFGILGKKLLGVVTLKEFES